MELTAQEFYDKYLVAFEDNEEGLITEGTFREFTEDLKDSFLTLEDLDGLESPDLSPYFQNNGNAFGADAYAGTNDGYDFYLKRAGANLIKLGHNGFNSVVTITSALTVNGGSIVLDNRLTPTSPIQIRSAATMILTTGLGETLTVSSGGQLTLGSANGNNIDLTPSGWVMFNNKDARYAGDYSAQYSTRSLIDKGYADGRYLQITALSNLTQNILFSSGNGIDTTAAGDKILNIGVTNAAVINYGNSATVHNFLGTAIYEYQTNAYVADKLITLNKGGAAASGIGVGFEIEENAVITGYLKTNAARNGFDFLAPAVADVISLYQNDSNVIFGRNHTFGAWANTTFFGASMTATQSYGIGVGVSNSIGFVGIFLGRSSTLSGTYNIGVGNQIILSGQEATGFGTYLTGTGWRSFLSGHFLSSTVTSGYVLGYGFSDAQRLVNDVALSMMFGVNSTVPSMIILGGSGAGTFGNVGIHMKTPAARLDILEGSAALAPFRIRKNAADKAAPLAGEFQFSSTGALQFCEVAGVWKTFSFGAGAAGAFVDGGNAFGANAVLGLTDAYNLTIQTTGTGNLLLNGYNVNLTGTYGAALLSTSLVLQVIEGYGIELNSSVSLPIMFYGLTYDFFRVDGAFKCSLDFDDLTADRTVIFQNKSYTLAGINNETFTGTTTFGTVNLPTLTASRVATIDATNNISVSAVTLVELGYLSGVTSAVQTQLNNLQTLIDLYKWITVKVTLTHAQILTLNSVPVTILPAPGVGMFYDVSSVLASMTFSGAAYGTNVNLRVKYSTTTSQVIANSSVILTQTTSVRWGRMALTAFASGSPQYVVNDSIILDTATGDPTGGGVGASLDVFVTYKLMTK